MEKQNLIDIAEVIEHEISVAREELVTAIDPDQRTRLRLTVQVLTVARLGVLRAASMCKG